MFFFSETYLCYGLGRNCFSFDEQNITISAYSDKLFSTIKHTYDKNCRVVVGESADGRILLYNFIYWPCGVWRE